jgi:Arc/MetJ family transcription regulator
MEREVAILQSARVLDITTSHRQCYDVMRTTLTLDDDVAVLLERVRKTRGLSLKKAVNLALRTGLRELTTPNRRERRFRTSRADLGRCLIGSLDDIAGALEIGEGEAFK